ncbi:MAG: hypothetical protein EBZ16_07645 [Flavobacteriia bacterium]|nr:hypothetical protein [Flavobacteriia bacterium]
MASLYCAAAWGQPASDAAAKRAAMASAILPGAGQFVNHQAWKAPIAWGILAGSGYFLRSRDYAILGVGAAYLFQVLDAYSSGFLVHFDVSPTLVGSVSPCPQPLAPLGAKIQLSWP